MAPEVVQDNPFYGAKCDIWSIGVLTFVLLVGYFPFKGENETEIKEKIKNFEKIDFENPAWENPAWKIVSPAAKDFIKKLLEKDQTKRLSADEAL